MTSWRRLRQEELRIVRWGCTYKRARLLYTATYIPDPRPTKTEEE